MLFTDIVDSTRLAEELADKGWRSLVAEHHRIVRRRLKELGGKELDTAGDGFFASFADPGSAVRCACLLSDDMRALGVGIRAGVHFGECEPADGKLSGITVVVGARVMGLATAGDVLVTSTVAELTRGAGFGLTDHGVQTLKGVEQPWQVYEVTSVDNVDRPEPLPPEEGAALRASVGATAASSARRRWWPVVVAAVLVLVIGGWFGWRATRSTTVVPSAHSVARVAADGSGFDLAVALQPGGSPQAVTTGDGKVWVADVRSQTVSEVVVTDDASVRVYGTPAPPTGLSHTADQVWVTFGFSSDPNRRVGVLQSGGAGVAPAGFIVPDGTSATDAADGAVWFVATRDAVVTRFDTTTSSVASVPVPAASGPVDVAVVAGGDTAWVAAGRSPSVFKVETSGGRPEVSAFSTGGAVPSAIATAPDGTVWVASQPNDTLLSLSAGGDSRLRLELGARCDAPTDLAVTSTQVWVTCGGSEHVVSLDPTDGSVTGTFPVDGAPVAVAVDDAGRPWVVVAEVG